MLAFFAREQKMTEEELREILEMIKSDDTKSETSNLPDRQAGVKAENSKTRNSKRTHD